jgi:hypothetical protein
MMSTPTFKLHRPEGEPPYVTVFCRCNERCSQGAGGKGWNSRESFPWWHQHTSDLSNWKKVRLEPRPPEYAYNPPEKMLQVLDEYWENFARAKREADEREAARVAEHARLAGDREAQRLAAMRIPGPWLRVRCLQGIDAGQVIQLRRQLALHRIACGTAVLAEQEWEPNIDDFRTHVLHMKAAS